MTATAKQIAAGAAAIRAAEAHHSPEETAEAVFKAMSAKQATSHEERVQELDADLAAENARPAREPLTNADDGQGPRKVVEAQKPSRKKASK